MLNPSRTIVMFLTLIAVVGLVLGLASDVGVFGWSLALVLALYLAVAGIAHRTRRSSDSTERPSVS
jgi:uncharacterized membrane protein required for colicin V production